MLDIQETTIFHLQRVLLLDRGFLPLDGIGATAPLQGHFTVGCVVQR